MFINILKIVGIIVVAIGSSVLLKVFFSKSKLNKIVKYVLTALIFSCIAVGCNFLEFSVDNYALILSDIVITVGGIVLGGYVALSSCVACSIERFFSVNYGTLSELQLSLLITYLFVGVFIFLFRGVVIRHEKIKWYYGVVIGLIIATFNLLIIFLTNTNDLSRAYEIVSVVALPNLIIKPLSVLLSLFIVAFPKARKSFKVEKPLHIQTITGLTLASAILVGFASVTGITYKVLDNNSKESTLLSINISLTDIENNIVSDVNNDCVSEIQNCIKIMKQFSLNKDFTDENATMAGYENAEEFKNHQEEGLLTIVNGRPVSDLTLIKEDGTIHLSSNSYIKNLNNISELNISQHNPATDKYSYEDYKYIPQLEAKWKFVYCNYFYLTEKTDFYVLASWNEEAYKSLVKSSIEKGIASRHLGENGFVVVTDNEKNVLSSPVDVGETFDINLDNLNSLAYYSLNNVEYYSYIEDYEGVKIISLMNKQDCDLNMNISLFITALTEVLVFFVLYCIIYLIDTKTIIKPLKKVTRSLDNIAKGNLDEKVNEYSNNELKSLSQDINTTVDALKDYMGREAKKIQEDLMFAQQIQHSAIPSTFPPFPAYTEFDIYASMDTAKEVGGDFYDFYLVDDRHLCILIADVSGKGIPAALFMMQSKTIIKSLVESKLPLDEAMTKANQKICENNAAQMFVTAWVGILDLDTGVLQYVNAGHNPPLIKHNGMFDYLKTKFNLVLAGFNGCKYFAQETILNKGDELFLYTDGVTEAKSASEELYGEQRLFISANQIKANSAQEMCEKILKDVKEYTINAEQSDDITMLSLKYFGK